MARAQGFSGRGVGLLTEEFNRVSPAGVATATRLEEMLDNSGMAFLVLTAEDEHGDKLAARQNVIHEAGLFQGGWDLSERSSFPRRPVKSSLTSMGWASCHFPLDASRPFLKMFDKFSNAKELLPFHPRRLSSLPELGPHPSGCPLLSMKTLALTPQVSRPDTQVVVRL